MDGRTEKIIIRALIILLIIIAFYFSRSIIKPILISIVLAYILNPAVNFMIKKGFSKRASTLILIFLILFIFAFTLFYIIPGVIKDILGMISNSKGYSIRISDYIKKLGYNELPNYLKNVMEKCLTRIEGYLTKYLNDFFNGLISFSMELPTYLLTPVFIFYFIYDKDYFIKLLKGFTSPIKRDGILDVWKKVDGVLGLYIRSQLILSLIISVLTFIAMSILNVRYTLIIAIINGFTNLIPYFGPYIGFVPAFFAALYDSPYKALWTGAAFLIIQQFESSVIAPKLMGDSLGIHPVFIMIIILLGGKYFGGLGLLLSVPVAGIIKVLYTHAIRNLY